MMQPYLHLRQWFSIRAILTLRGHLAISGHIFWARGAAKHYRTHKTASPPTKNYRVQNVNGVKVEKPWSRGKDRKSFQNHILVIKGKFSWVTSLSHINIRPVGRPVGWVYHIALSGILFRPSHNWRMTCFGNNDKAQMEG